MRNAIRRREFLIAGTTALATIPHSLMAEVVPNSTGSELPRASAPTLACDAHFHIYDARFPGAVPGETIAKGATLRDYRLLQRRLGTTRAVPVQPKYYGTNHDCILDALKQLGTNGRGIGVLRPDVEQKELHRLNAGGIRGLRFSVWEPKDAITTIDMIEPLAHRISPLGWHVQLHMSGDQIAEAASMLRRLPCPIVFDHMGRLPPQLGIKHPAFKVIADLLESGNAWVKLAGAYLNTVQGPPYDDATVIAKAFVRLAPERMVWGSDWPHGTERQKPDDAALFDLLGVWSGGDAIRNRILVANPSILYGFSAA